jgi:hypothetical protein
MTALDNQPAFDRFLFRGSGDVATIDTGRARIERRSLGAIDIPDGRVYACDPGVPVDDQPLAQRLAPGSYEVVLFVAVRTDSDLHNSTAERNAAAALVCSSGTPERWEPASRQGVPADATAYAVDSGAGCFMGTRATQPIFEADAASGNAIMEALKEASGAIVALKGEAAAAVFTSGCGDGVYDTWLGRDARGEVSMILTDFGILESADYVAATRAKWAMRAAKKWWQFWR